MKTAVGLIVTASVIVIGVTTAILVSAFLAILVNALP